MKYIGLDGPGPAPTSRPGPGAGPLCKLPGYYDSKSAAPSESDVIMIWGSSDSPWRPGDCPSDPALRPTGLDPDRGLPSPLTNAVDARNIEEAKQYYSIIQCMSTS